MIALTIEDGRLFVSKLLVQNTFDKFYVGESVVKTFADFKMGGSLNTGYFSSDEQQQLDGRHLCLWSEIKPFAYQLIKGHKLPVSFQFVLQLSDENTRWLLEKNKSSVPADAVEGLYMNLRYEKNEFSCVTGISFKTFILDKTVEQLWDETVKTFFKQQHIAVTEK